MKNLKTKLILSLGLVMGMCSAFPASAIEIVVQKPVLKYQPHFAGAVQENVVTASAVSNQATWYCHVPNRVVNTQCITTLVDCVLGENNRFGCEAKSDANEEYACDAENDAGDANTVETMVSDCHDHPNPFNYNPQTAVLPNSTLPPRLTAPGAEPRYTVDLDPSRIRRPDFRIRVTGDTEPRTDTTVSDDAGDAMINENEEDNTIADSGSDENAGTGRIGLGVAGGACSLSTGSGPFSLMVWIPNLMLALWALRKKK